MSAKTKVYKVQINDDEPVQYAGTMAGVKTILKDRDSIPMYWPDVRVTECEVQSDKEGLIFALNRLPVMTEGREWRGTSRGGLKEML